jgi:hypothetical protein
MYGNYVRPSVRWGVRAVAIHWLICVPFLLLGPMLATPSHGGIIGWTWTGLEYPAAVVYFLLGLDRISVFGSSVMGEFLNFVVWGTVCWLIIGILVSMSVQLVRQRRAIRLTRTPCTPPATSSREDD